MGRERRAPDRRLGAGPPGRRHAAAPLPVQPGRLPRGAGRGRGQVLRRDDLVAADLGRPAAMHNAATLLRPLPFDRPGGPGRGRGSSTAAARRGLPVERLADPDLRPRGWVLEGHPPMLPRPPGAGRSRRSRPACGSSGSPGRRPARLGAGGGRRLPTASSSRTGQGRCWTSGSWTTGGCGCGSATSTTPWWSASARCSWTPGWRTSRGVTSPEAGAGATGRPWRRCDAGRARPAVRGGVQRHEPVQRRGDRVPAHRPASPSGTGPAEGSAGARAGSRTPTVEPWQACSLLDEFGLDLQARCWPAGTCPSPRGRSRPVPTPLPVDSWGPPPRSRSAGSPRSMAPPRNSTSTVTGRVVP